jgi:DNA recombination protein RmuC
MEIWIAAVVALFGGLAVGGALTALVLKERYAARLAAADTERVLLRERVDDLETSLAEDLETATLLAPLKDTLTRVESKVGVLERDRVEQFSSLRTLMLRVESQTEGVGRATSSLAGSLRSSNVRGAWGEVQLRRVLEMAGMLARTDFDEQVRTVSVHGREVRPDAVIHLPGDKHLVLDAKAPMNHFLDAQAEDLGDDERAELLTAHADALGKHVGALAAKSYWSAFTTAPEMVVCFVPSDAMLATALAARPSLHESAMSQKVVLVGPGALMALPRTVAFTWQQDSLSASARELLAVGRELYQRLSTLGDHATKLGRTLQSSVEAYNAMVGSLESRVLVTARRMQALEVVTDELAPLTPVTSGPRLLTAQELIDAATSEDARPELLLPLPPREQDTRATG